MNYHAHYNRLVERAKSRNLNGYVEQHHAVPRCMGGTDDKSNIVSLTAREHFVAHQLLVKIYPNEGGLIAAVNYFNARKKIAASRTEKLYTEEQKAELSASRLEKQAIRKAAGIPHYNKGKKHTEEWKKNNSLLFKGKKQTPEQIAKRMASRNATYAARRAECR